MVPANSRWPSIGAVLAPGDELASGDADDLRSAAGAEIPQIAVVLAVVRLRHQHLDVAADDLLGGIAEQAFRRRIEAEDRAALVDGDQPVEDGAHHRAQEHLGVLLALAVGDVANGPDEHAPRAVAHLVDAELHREDAAVLAPRRYLAADADHLRDSGLDIAAQVAVVPGVVRLGHQHAHVLPDHLVRLVAEDARRRWIEAVNDAPVVDRHQAVDDGVEHRAQQLGVVGQRLFGRGDGHCVRSVSVRIDP